VCEVPLFGTYETDCWGSRGPHYLQGVSLTEREESGDQVRIRAHASLVRLLCVVSTSVPRNPLRGGVPGSFLESFFAEKCMKIFGNLTFEIPPRMAVRGST